MGFRSLLSIVIPTHNRKEFTRACLELLMQQTQKEFRIIVVDDGSTDGTDEMIRTYFGQITILHGDGNLWWTGATNMGIGRALEMGATHIMTLNDDTLPPPDFIANMMRAAMNSPGSLIGAAAVDSKSGVFVYGGERINWKWGNSISLLDVLKPEEMVGLHEVTHYPGRGLLIPADVFREIGLFDGMHFPQAVADYDFTHRATRAGYRIYCNFDAPLAVVTGASASITLRERRNLRKYFEHMFGIRGGANLKRFTQYALRNCPKQYLPFFLVRGYVQRILGYWTRSVRQFN